MKAPNTGLETPAQPRKPAIRVLDDGATSELPLPPGPAFLLPVVGETSAYSALGPMKFGLERHAKYGPVFKTSLWGAEMYMVTDMAIHKQFMLEDSKAHLMDTAGTFGKVLGPFATKILANKDGARMPFRRSMMGAMSAEALNTYALRIVEMTEAELERLSQAEGGWELNGVTRQMAANFGNRLLVGLDDLTPQDIETVKDDLLLMFDSLFTFDVDLPGLPLRKAIDARERLLKRVLVSIQKQGDQLTKEIQPSAPGKRPRKSMMGYLMEHMRSNDDEMPLDDLGYLAVGLMQAATDTSSSGFNGLLVMVAQLPEVMQKIREEQRSLVAKHGPAMTKEILDNSTYLDAVVKEALRLNSPAAAQFRKTFKEMEVAGYRIPKGSSVFMNVLASHALELAPDWPAGYPDLSTPPSNMDKDNLQRSFKPERWLNDATRPTLSTFGHGPHTCLGIPLYVMEAKSLLAIIARKYDFELLADGPIVWQDFPMVRPVGEVRVRTMPLKAPAVAQR